MSTLVEDLEELLHDVKAAFKVAVADGKSSNGIAALSRQVQQVTVAIHEERQRIARLEAEQEDDGWATEDDLVDAAVVELCALPDPLLDRVLAGLADAGRGAALRRNAPPGLHVVGE